MVAEEATEVEQAADLPSADGSSEHVIDELEDFIRRNPSSHNTQEARFRLATAYFEREQQRFIEGLEEPGARLDGFVDHADSIRVWQAYLAVEGTFAPSPNQRAQAAYMLGRSLQESHRSADALDVWRAVVCPESLRTHDYHHCQPIDSGAAIGDIWMNIGTHHFEARELALATESFEQVERFGRDNVRSLAYYMLAWSHLDGRQAQALDYFQESLMAAKSPCS